MSVWLYTSNHNSKCLKICVISNRTEPLKKARRKLNPRVMNLFFFSVNSLKIP